jgi:pyrimidine operon attenuation protein/uracil phosphoribosyltransferase
MDGSLGTTNTILTVMAVMSVLEALVIIGIGAAMFMAYRRIMALVNELEVRHVAPTMLRVHSILDDVKSVSATVKADTDRVENAIHSTINRVDDTVDRMRSNVRSKTSRIIGFVRGARVALETILQSRAA